MVKNAIDVIYGGLSYWLYGFGFSFGIANGNNPFCGIGKTTDLPRKTDARHENFVLCLYY